MEVRNQLRRGGREGLKRDWEGYSERRGGELEEGLWG